MYKPLTVIPCFVEDPQRNQRPVMTEPNGSDWLPPLIKTSRCVRTLVCVLCVGMFLITGAFKFHVHIFKFHMHIFCKC